MPARFPCTHVATATAPAPAAAPSEPGPMANLPPVSQLLASGGGREVWARGPQYVQKIRANYPGGEIEAQNANFVAQQLPDSPVAKVTHAWTTEEGRRFNTVQERMAGQTLEDALPGLAPADLANIGRQLGAFLRELRALTASEMRMLDGRPVVDRRLFKPFPSTPMTQGASYQVCTQDSEIAENLVLAIASASSRFSVDILQMFLHRMPSAKPFTFSHSDLHEGNIMVRDGEFAGLIDWELAGYYPRWWEFVNSCELLSDYLPADLQETEALNWFRIYHAIRERPDDEATAKMLDDYLRG